MKKISVSQMIVRANSHLKNGEILEAEQIYAEVVMSFPSNVKAKQGLRRTSFGRTPPQKLLDKLIQLINEEQLELAVTKANNLAIHYPKSGLLWNILGIASAKIGQFDQAIKAFERIITFTPNQASAYYNLGNVYKDKGLNQKAVNAYTIALELKPNYEEASKNLSLVLASQDQDTGQRLADVVDKNHKLQMASVKKANKYFNVGLAKHEDSKLDEAIEFYKKSIEQFPNFPKAYYNMSAALQIQGKLEDAIASYEKALSLDPDYTAAYINMGNVLKVQGKLDKAIASYEKALLTKPDYADAYFNIGNVLKVQGKLDKAIAAFDKALSLDPDCTEAYINMGNVLKVQGKLDKAIASYEKALLTKPDYADAYFNMGNVLKVQGKLDKAIASYEKALSLDPEHTDTYHNMGNVLTDQGKLDKAIASYEKALLTKPDHPAAQSQKMHLQAHICDWSTLLEDRSLISGLGLGALGKGVPPFAMLSLEDAPEHHRLRSENFAREKFPVVRDKGFIRPSDMPKRLKVGYFSADFHNHATMYLLARIFEQHQKEKFEIYAYSYGPDKQDDMRNRLIASVDVFHDVRKMNDMQIVELAKSEQLDIAIDLKGYTKDTRLAIFAHRLAPLQMSYLGYPGTLGANFIDYMIADRVVIPTDKRKYYSEQIIYLPNTYQPTDNTREICDAFTKREDAGLPSNGFVFCCFNNSYKISPREFDIWMRLLQKVEGSVLWLLKLNKWAEKNLKREAEARGVNAKRLIFAEELPQAEHLARQKLADLFIDTFNVNAHTTTSDALWAGLPVVTKSGQGFAARVAGSLLHAVGLPELITETEDKYEALALKLAKNPKLLAQIKTKLANNRLTQPLFDTEQYTRHLEAGYIMAYDRYLKGREPEHIYISK